MKMTDEEFTKEVYHSLKSVGNHFRKTHTRRYRREYGRVIRYLQKITFILEFERTNHRG